jgi:hypothetical protein
VVVKTAPIDVFTPLVKISLIANEWNAESQPQLDDGGYREYQ